MGFLDRKHGGEEAPKATGRRRMTIRMDVAMHELLGDHAHSEKMHAGQVIDVALRRYFAELGIECPAQ